MDLKRYEENKFWDAHPSDVNSRIAIIVSTHLMRYPNTEEFRDPDLVERESFEFVESVMRDVLSEQDATNFQVSRYEVGPTAQPPLSIMFTVAENVGPLLTYGASLITWGLLAERLVQKFREWRKWKVDPVPQEIILSEPMLLGMCFKHFSDNYVPRAIDTEIVLTSICRSPFEFASAGSPEGSEHFLVNVHIHQENWIYLVTSRGGLIEHFKTGPEGIEIPDAVATWESNQIGHQQSLGVVTDRRTIKVKLPGDDV